MKNQLKSSPLRIVIDHMLLHFRLQATPLSKKWIRIGFRSSEMDFWGRKTSKTYLRVLLFSLKENGQVESFCVIWHGRGRCRLVNGHYYFIGYIPTSILWIYRLKMPDRPRGTWTRWIWNSCAQTSEILTSPFYAKHRF